MKRLLIYVHFNKYDHISRHVFYQIEHMRPLFEKLVFISNSKLSLSEVEKLREKKLIDEFIQRENTGYDFGAWHDGMALVGFDELKEYDSITVMNDTCFGPLWDMEPIYQKYESDSEVDFWGMTNHQEVKQRNLFINEHLQSYFISFKNRLIQSTVFQKFWQSVENYIDVQKVIDNYETQYTKKFVDAGFKYQTILNTIPLKDDFFHSNFTIHYPHVLLENHVPFIKIKTFDLTQHLAPYLLKAIEQVSDYPIEFILSHMSDMSLPTPPYLLDRKVLKDNQLQYSNQKKVAVHLHTYYVDLLEEFLMAFENFHFTYDLFLTTDSEKKKVEIEKILTEHGKAGKVYITGNRGRDVIPMLRLKKELSKYDYIGHFHTKKSPEYPHWVGDSWRNELFDMLIKPADKVIASLENDERLGLVIADIPTFFRYTKIVDPWNENKFADDMNLLWERMNIKRSIDFNQLNTFIMSYGTFIWFKYDALKPLFDLNLQDADIPAEPLPQHTILHSIERILVYLAWSQRYDYAISKNEIYITPFVDNTVLNIRPDTLPNTYINFDNIGGIKGALKYIYRGPGSAIKYLLRRLKRRIIS
ncbi:MULTISPECIES: rhamnan synthesis F family protein [unclassified Streptococcus]|uniref:rhamnan synthesis F family protein n=1 Tax=unclassified Streptococcus TaxID=2608887 RepID=UPI000735571C|nr:MULTISPECIES: rhamnan synthesis F family protein [unclassified Streptococcus]OFN53659.1 alpha-L-Rha alpha-1,3-L-rhamnosyltransferase [Streptococcus sp. HMSC034B05]PNM83379.1 alpha-L-Rha alpha-1,3-L-rhamnosyltransferase [Streptococcus sp. FDAARGOS_146]